MDYKKLQEPFGPEDIEWRIGQAGKTKDGKPYAKVLAYLTNRAIMQRLDDVCSPENWWNEYKEWNVGDKHGVLCGLTIQPNPDEFASCGITKWDGAENTDIESVKGGLSDAMKRAAVQWGIGRYLYNMGDTFANCSLEKKAGWNYAKTKDGIFWWETPKLPAWALPSSKHPDA